jgi:predicted DNA-binding transcriptional regulator AlpA
VNDLFSRKAELFATCGAPVGLSREQAAFRVGISGTLFDQMVDDGRMPKPKKINGRRVWDREAVDLAFRALPADDDANEWDTDDESHNARRVGRS